MSNFRPLQAEAFNLALRELARVHPEASRLAYVADAVMDAVLDNASAGETEIEAIARYAANKGLAVYEALKSGA